MPIPLTGEHPSICVRREAFERASLERSVLDHREDRADDDLAIVVLRAAI